MINTSKGHFGSFLIGGREVTGELRIDDRNTRLHLHSQEEFSPVTDGSGITGILHDLTKVTLLGCIGPTEAGYTSGPQGIYYNADIFSHFVITGDFYVSVHEASITRVVVYLDDANIVFDDPLAFGAEFMGSEPLVKQIIEASSFKANKNIPTGSNARILYFAGHDEIAVADTAIGRIQILHRPKFKVRQGGVLKQRIAISLAFDSAITFEEAIRRTNSLIRYIGLLAGRRQKIRDLFIETQQTREEFKLLQVHWSLYKRKRIKGRKPLAFDVLIDGSRSPQEFSLVTTGWFRRSELLHGARFRFFTSFEKSTYDIDRLIAAANMFDILPESLVPATKVLNDEITDARDRSRSLFKDLPHSFERDTILGALGRLNQNTLKDKVRLRANVILAASAEHFPSLTEVASLAVDCRNFYVHGSRPAFDYDRNFDAVIFLTNTLEFIFACSDLIESGWNFQEWLRKPKARSHHFSSYVAEYAQNTAWIEELRRR